jgi:hypothetical protein
MYARGRLMRAAGWRALLQRPVRSVRVVVIDVLPENEAEMPLSRDQQPVQALAACAGDPAFGDGIRARRADGSLDYPPADRGEHCVERRGELGVPVPDQEFQAASAALEVRQQVAGLLSYLCAGGVGGDPG